MFSIVNKSINICCTFGVLYGIKKDYSEEDVQAKDYWRKAYSYRAFEQRAAKTCGWRSKNAVKELIKEEFILQKPTSYGLQVSLNPEKIEEIIKIIEN